MILYAAAGGEIIEPPNADHMRDYGLALFTAAIVVSLVMGY